MGETNGILLQESDPSSSSLQRDPKQGEINSEKLSSKPSDGTIMVGSTIFARDHGPVSFSYTFSFAILRENELAEEPNLRTFRWAAISTRLTAREEISGNAERWLYAMPEHPDTATKRSEGLRRSLTKFLASFIHL